MSQPASPIGSVEFIVKFETMQSGFLKVMKQAMKDLDIGGEDDTTQKKLDEILFNLRSRIQHFFTRSRKDLLLGAEAEIFKAQKPETKQELIEHMLTSPTGKRLFPKGPEEEPQAFGERIEKMAEVLLERYGEMINKAVKNPAFWERQSGKIIDMQAAMQAGLKGNWQHLIKIMFNQILVETDIEDITRQRLIAAGIYTPGSQRKMSQLRMDIGEGKKGVIAKEDIAGLYSTLGQYLSKENLEAMTRVPGKTEPSELTNLDNMLEEIGEFLSDWTVEEGAPIYNVIGKVMKAYLEGEGTTIEGSLLRQTGKQPDLPLFITEDQIDLLKDIFEEDIFDKEAVEEYINIVRNRFKETEAEWIMLPWDAKILGTLEKMERLKEKYGELTMMISAIGNVPGIMGVLEQKGLVDPAKVGAMSQEKLIEEYGGNIKELLLLALGNKELMERLNKTIEDHPDLAKIWGVGQ